MKTQFTKLTTMIFLMVIGNIGWLKAITVVDPTLIKTNLLNAKKDLAQQIIQEANQKTQIFRLEQQIKQAEDYLRRMGKPEEVNLKMLREILRFLERLEKNRSSAEIVKEIGSEEIFQTDPQGGPAQEVSKQILIDGKSEGLRQGEDFSEEVATRRTLAHYRAVKEAALIERRELKKQFALSLRELQGAKTSSEVQKISAILNSLQTQLAATDSEIRVAADEVLTRFLHNQNEKEIASKARVQEQRVRLRVGTSKDIERYRLPTKPFLFPRER